jgi:hypothetical protein
MMTNAMTTIAVMKAKVTMGTKSSSAADEARSTVIAVLSDLFGGTKDGGETRHGGGGGDGVCVCFRQLGSGG